MPSTESLSIFTTKRIIIAILSIIAAVASAVLISIIIPDKKDKKAPKLPGLTHYDSASGVFSFDYPAFFEKIGEGTYGFRAFIGLDLMVPNIFDKVDLYLKGKGWMVINIMPISEKSKSLTEQLISFGDSRKNWITVVETISALGKPGEDFIYREKRIRARIFGVKYYHIVRIQTSDGFHVIALAIVNKKNWKNYKKEIQDSFKSIEFFPSVARELLKKLLDDKKEASGSQKLK